MKYCVPVFFRGMDNFIVEASNPAEAQAKAEQLFKDGAQPDECGNESQEFERAGTPEEIR